MQHIVLCYNFRLHSSSDSTIDCFLSLGIYISLVLVQPRKTRPCLTERLLMGCKESNQTNKQTNSLGIYSKTCHKQPLKKKTKFGLQDRLSLNAGQKYCRMLQREHSAILSTFIKLLFVIKSFVLSIFGWPLKTGFTICHYIFSFL